jgi:CheY-like chemotaxis protein
MPPGVVIVACGNAARRECFVRALSGAGWETALAVPSMSEAAGLIRNAPNACVIIDAELEDIPGLKAAGILRKLRPDAKIIFTAPENTRDLEVEVRALDVFYYYISSADQAELVAAVEDAVGAPRPGKAKHRLKVLVVDDDGDFHAAARTVLHSAGYDVVSAYAEREGLDAARRERPDAILLDIIMGTTTDGFEFCREARRDPLLKHTPIIGISAIEERIALQRPPDRDPGLFPVDSYLRKPVALERLLGELRRLIPSEG